MQTSRTTQLWSSRSSILIVPIACRSGVSNNAWFEGRVSSGWL